MPFCCITALANNLQIQGVFAPYGMVAIIITADFSRSINILKFLEFWESTNDFLVCYQKCTYLYFGLNNKSFLFALKDPCMYYNNYIGKCLMNF